MSCPQLGRAIEVWDRLVKSEINKPLPAAPNREKGKWAEKTDAINDRTNSETQKPQLKPDHKKDERPYNPFKWIVKHPDGTEYQFKMSPNGAMKVTRLGEYRVKTYSLAEWAAIHHAGIAHQENEANNQDNKKEKPVETITKAQINAADTELDRIQKALTPLRWGQMPRYIGEKVGNTIPPEPQRTTPVTPAPTAAQQLRGSRSNSPLNGHQLAAQRCGLDPHTPGVEKMSVDQMKQAAHEVNVKATAPLAFKAGLQYRR
jgi:hypothetical protein